MSKLYFSKTLFEMNRPNADDGNKGWTSLCDGKRVIRDEDAPLGLTCKVDDVEFYVADEWCAKHYPRRRAIARYKRSTSK